MASAASDAEGVIILEEAKQTLSQIFLDNDAWSGMTVTNPPSMVEKDVETREAQTQIIVKFLEQFPELGSHLFKMSSATTEDSHGFVPLTYLVCNQVTDEQLLERVYQICPDAIHVKQGENSVGLLRIVCNHGFVSNDIMLWLCSKLDSKAFQESRNNIGRTSGEVGWQLYPLFDLLRTNSLCNGFISMNVLQLFLEKFPVFTDGRNAIHLLECMALLGYPSEMLQYVVSQLPETGYNVVKFDLFSLSRLHQPHRSPIRNMHLGLEQAMAVSQALGKIKTLYFVLRGAFSGDGWAFLINSAAAFPNIHRFSVEIMPAFFEQNPEIAPALSAFLAAKSRDNKVFLHLYGLHQQHPRFNLNYEERCGQFFQHLLEGIQMNRYHGKHPIIEELRVEHLWLLQRAWIGARGVLGSVSRFSCWPNNRLPLDIMRNETQLHPSVHGVNKLLPILSCLQRHNHVSRTCSVDFNYQLLPDTVAIASKNCQVAFWGDQDIQRRVTCQFLISLTINIRHGRGNLLSNTPITPVIEEAVKIPSLKKLCFTGEGHRADGDLLCRILQTNSTLQKLTLRGISLTGNNVEALPGMLLNVATKQTTSLEEICIWSYGVIRPGNNNESGQIFAHENAFETRSLDYYYATKLPRPPQQFVDYNSSMKLSVALALNRFGIQKVRVASSFMKRINFVNLLVAVLEARLTAEEKAFRIIESKMLNASFETLRTRCALWCADVVTMFKYDVDTVNCYFGLLMENPIIWLSVQQQSRRKRKRG